MKIIAKLFSQGLLKRTSLAALYTTVLLCGLVKSPVMFAQTGTIFTQVNADKLSQAFEKNLRALLIEQLVGGPFGNADVDYPVAGGFEGGNETYYVSGLTTSTSGDTSNINYQNGAYNDGSVYYTSTHVDASSGQFVVDLSLSTDCARAAVWIDWNQNGSFTDPDEQVLDTTGEANTCGNPINTSFMVNVPTDAVSGVVRMRVVMKDAWGGALSPSEQAAVSHAVDFDVSTGVSAGQLSALDQALVTLKATYLEVALQGATFDQDKINTIIDGYKANLQKAFLSEVFKSDVSTVEQGVGVLRERVIQQLTGISKRPTEITSVQDAIDQLKYDLIKQLLTNNSQDKINEVINNSFLFNKNNRGALIQLVTTQLLQREDVLGADPQSTTVVDLLAGDAADGFTFTGNSWLDSIEYFDADGGYNVYGDGASELTSISTRCVKGNATYTTDYIDSRRHVLSSDFIYNDAQLLSVGSNTTSKGFDTTINFSPLTGLQRMHLVSSSQIDGLAFTQNPSEPVLLCDTGTEVDPDDVRPWAFGIVSSDRNRQSLLVNNPRIVMGPPSYNDTDPVVARVIDSGSNEFTYQLQEWDYLDGSHDEESIGFFSTSDGRSTLGDLDVEAGKLNGLNHNWKQVSFSETLSNGGLRPIVFAQVVSTNNEAAVTTRIRNVTATGFEVRLQQQEQNGNGSLAREEVHWVAVESGSTTLASGEKVVVRRTGEAVRDVGARANFGEYLVGTASQILIAQMQTFNGADPATLRYESISSQDFVVKVEEERSADSEVRHAAEAVGYMVIGSDVPAEPPGLFRTLRDTHSNLCMDVDGGNTANGTNVQLWHCNGSNAQKWYYDAPNGFLRSRLNPNKCLSNRGQASNGSSLVLWDCNDSDNQRFDLVGNSLRNRHDSNFVVQAAGVSPGANVVQWRYNGNDNQQWFLDGTEAIIDHVVGSIRQVPVNVAVNKSATQSSTWQSSAASRAVDGNIDGNHRDNDSTTHTNFDVNAWWEVDLGELYDLTSITLWNRTDCCSDRLSNFHVLISDVPFSSKNLAATREQDGVTTLSHPGTAGRETTLNTNRTGRYVRVQLAGTNYLQLAEVEVMGVPYAERNGERETIFAEDFENGDVSRWATNGGVSASSDAAYTGSFGAQLTQTSSMDVAIDLTRYTDIFVEYVRIAQALDSSAEEYLTSEWYDGESWNHIESAYIDWNGRTLRTFALPPAADENPDFRLRFSLNANASDEKGYVDDITITGIRKGINIGTGLQGSFESKFKRYQVGQQFNGIASNIWNEVAWKNDRVHKQLIIWSDTNLNDVNFTVSNLAGVDGTIDASNVKLRFAEYVKADKNAAGNNQTFGAPIQACAAHDRNVPDYVASYVELADALSTHPVSSISAGGDPIKAWVTIDVPVTANAGDYAGTIEVTASGQTTQVFDINLQVADKTLADPSDWGFHLDLWQFPISVLNRYESATGDFIPWYSQAHFDVLEPSYRLLADMGQKAVTTYIKTGALGEYSMIGWIRDPDGSWRYNFTNFDKFVEKMAEWGIDGQINAQSMLGWNANQLQFYDVATDSEVTINYEPGDAVYTERWHHFLTAFKAHLEQKGWFDKTVLYFDEVGEETLHIVYDVIDAHDPTWKKGATTLYIPNSLRDRTYDSSPLLEAFIEPNAADRSNKVSTFYTSCFGLLPNNYLTADVNLADSVWMGWHAEESKLNGYLRWAFDNWLIDDPLDVRVRANASGDFSLIYRDSYNAPAQTLSSMRLELLREGIQDFEKIQQLKSEGDACVINALNTETAKFSFDFNEDIMNSNSVTLVPEAQQVLKDLATGSLCP